MASPHAINGLASLALLAVCALAATKPALHVPRPAPQAAAAPVATEPPVVTGQEEADQADTTFRLPDCQESELARVSGLPLDRLEKGIGFSYVLEGGRLLSTDLLRPEVSDRELKPLDRMVVLARSPDGLSLLVRHHGDATACGWIGVAELLGGESKGRASLAYGPMPIAADPNTLPPPIGLALRAVVSGRNATFLARPDDGELSPAAVPDAALFHVFSIATRTHQATGETSRWFLLGVRELETELIGWVRSDQASLVGTAMLPTPPTRPTGAAVVGLEPATARWLTSVARDLCAEVADDHALDMLWRSIDSRIGPGRRKQLDSPADLLAAMLGLPRDRIPAVYSVSWEELATRHRHLTKGKREALQASICAKARTLQEARDSQPEPTTAGISLVKLPLRLLE